MICRHPNPEILTAAEWCPECGAIRIMVCAKFRPWKIPASEKLARDPKADRCGFKLVDGERVFVPACYGGANSTNATWRDKCTCKK